VLVRNVNGSPVTGSATTFFSDGHRRPIWAIAEDEHIRAAAAQAAKIVL
jgi:hypothetical protein